MAHPSSYILSLRVRRNLAAYVLLIPILLLLTLVLVIPSMISIVNSFYDWNLLKPAEKAFNLITNYKTVLAEGTFVKSIIFTFGFIVVTMLVEIVLGMGTALITSEMPSLVRKIVNTALFVPYLLSPLTVGLMWRLLFSYNGLLNSFVVLFGLKPIAWMVSFETAFIASTISEIWRSYPFGFLLLASAMSTFPVEPYEAAKVDGASRLQTFIYITLPFCQPTMIIIVIYQIILKLRVFDLVYILTAGGPVDSTTPLGFLIYKYLFRYYNAGWGSATAVFVLLCSIAISFVVLRYLHPDD